MKTITLKGSWIIKAPLEKVFEIVTDFENIPQNFPKVAHSITITKKDGDYQEMDAEVKSFGSVFPVKMKTKIIPGKGFISDNESPKFGTSGHEEFFLEEVLEGTKINYTYEVSIHKKWLRIVAGPLIGRYSMKFWEKAFVDRLKEMLEKEVT